MSKKNKCEKEISAKPQSDEQVGFFSRWRRRLKSFFKKAASFLLNPHLLICFGIAWLITNGWCYIFIVLGTWLDIGWMLAVGTGYAAFLWIPFTPEKLITIIISIFLLRIIFPKDEKTLKVLKDDLEAIKAMFRRRKEKHRAKKAEKQSSKK